MGGNFAPEYASDPIACKDLYVKPHNFSGCAAATCPAKLVGAKMEAL